MGNDSEEQASAGVSEKERRDFLIYTTAVVGATGAVCAVWPFVHSMNPSKDTLALSSTEVDLSPIEEGQSITVMWRGKPVFVRHRTADEISEANDTNLASLPDPEPDTDRVVKPQWLVTSCYKFRPCNF